MRKIVMHANIANKGICAIIAISLEALPEDITTTSNGFAGTKTDVKRVKLHHALARFSARQCSNAAKQNMHLFRLESNHSMADCYTVN
jgi:hypothetical protein